MYVCMCVCVYVCVYVHVHDVIYVYMYYTHPCRSLSVCVRVFVQEGVCL